MNTQNKVILRIRFPFETEEMKLQARIAKYERLYYSLFHLLLNKKKTLSFEIVVLSNIIKFYIVAERTLVSALTSLVFAEFSDIELAEVSDYDDAEMLPQQALGFYLDLAGSKAFSLRVAGKTDSDPLLPFYNLLSDVPPNDGMLYQVMIDPLDETVMGDTGGGVYGFSEKQEAGEIHPKFRADIRILYFFPETRKDLNTIYDYFENIFSPFSTERNHIEVKPAKDLMSFADNVLNRVMERNLLLTTDEVASFFHSPDPTAKIRGVDWLFSRKAEPPLSLPTADTCPPDQISLFATTNFRGREVTFGLMREDRRRHLYSVGKSGSGKSKLLEKLIADDIVHGKGVCVIDPHGDLIQAALQWIPKERYKDLVYFNPSDLDYPIAFNPLENVGREFKQQVTYSLIEIFKKFFGGDWSPKIEHVFRFTILALLDFKQATLMSVQKMLTDRPYRQMIIEHIQDQVVKKFWANEFSSWSEKFDNEAIVPLVNKLGQFLANEMVRNIVAQSKNKVDLDDIMNNSRILLIELSKGKLGDENSALLGSLIITKIQQQGMKRAFMAEEKRADFYLYVDEFQNFSTKTFDDILSEARKYRISLTVSHQFLGQLSQNARETVFGNVGSIITFRMGADDAAYLAQEFAPRFSGHDIMNLDVRSLYVKMSINGSTPPAFSARTMNVVTPQKTEEEYNELINTSRSKYATYIQQVLEEFEALYENRKPEKKEEKIEEEVFEVPIV
ncbi:type IV secretory system conjugative DNA transfer family protein [Candidatus Uhrbacteria bacterium]|nr:type IV secretory system conjugative DNA transfer family protein [Candidatus Uhrbacteria bacterium]